MTGRSLELSDAISALVVQQPFYAVLIFDLLEIHETETSPGGGPLPSACTDGRAIYINPAFFKQINVQERIGVLCHEVLHVVLRHCERTRGYIDLGVGPDMKPFNPKKANHAQDYIINQMLADSGFKLPLGALFNPQITAADIWDEVYPKIPDPPEDDGNWDQHPVATDPASLPDPTQIQRAVKMAAAAQKASGQGTLPGAMQRLVDEICEPKVVWTDHILRTIQNIIGNDEYTYRRPNKRKLAMPPHIYLPGRTGSRSGTGVIEVDTSGSIGEDFIKAWFGEMHGILTQCNPETTYVGFVDAELYNDELHELNDVNDLLDLKSKVGGGGGTDMTVIFREIQKRDIAPDFVVILTDGYTPFGEDPGYPVIWCIAGNDGCTAPFGLTVHVPMSE